MPTFKTTNTKEIYAALRANKEIKDIIPNGPVLYFKCLTETADKLVEDKIIPHAQRVFGRRV